MQVSEAWANLSGWPQVSDEISVLDNNLPNLGFFKQKQTSSSFSLLTKDTAGQDKQATNYKNSLLLINILKKFTRSIVNNLTYISEKLSVLFSLGFLSVIALQTSS